MKNILIIALFCIAASYSSAQRDTLPKLSVAHLISDFDLFRYNMESVHAGMYLYTSKSTFDSIFDSLRSEIKEPMDVGEFYQLLLPIHNYLRNGHTMILPSTEWDEFKDKQAGLLPFDIYYDDKGLYVLRNLSEYSDISEGLKLETIDGRSAIEYFSEMIDLWTKDGYNRSFPAELVSLEFSNMYANMFGLQEDFELTFSDHSGRLIHRTVLGSSRSQMEARHEGKYGEVRIPWYEEEVDLSLKLRIDGETAYLTVPTFDKTIRGENGMKFRRYYKYAFEQIAEAGVKNLVLDLRNNGGGDPQPVIALFSHLHDAPFKVTKSNQTLMKRLPNPQYYSGMSFYNMIAPICIRNREEGGYEVAGIIPRMLGDEKEGYNEPSKNNFDGELYVLVNGRSFSATGEIVGLIRYHNLGTIIGDEVGGNPSQLVAGICPILTLPHSGIRCRLSLIYNQIAVEFEEKGRGIIPEYQVRNTIEEELTGHDSVMEFTLNLIEERGSYNETLSIN